jgi:tetratricopeptide (TPR) repeat protein
MAAMRASAWELAASAAIELSYNIGMNQARRAEGLIWSGHAEVALGFADDFGELREASRLNNLGNILSAGVREEQDEARSAFERAISIYEGVLGPDHPNVGGVLSNLSNLHHRLGNYSEASAMGQRSLEINEAALGLDHPNVAWSLWALGNVNRSQGEYGAAKERYERAIAIWEKALGPDHPNVAMVLNNLGAVHDGSGSREEARALYQRAVESWEKGVGPDHPNVGFGLANIGKVELALGHAQEALVVLERAVSIYDAHPGGQPAEPGAHFDLARALVVTGGDRDRALSEAEKARTEFRAAGKVSAKELAEVEAWIVEQEAER